LVFVIGTLEENLPIAFDALFDYVGPPLLVLVPGQLIRPPLAVLLFHLASDCDVGTAASGQAPERSYTAPTGNRLLKSAATCG
jgi:hypothetical protein